MEISPDFLAKTLPELLKLIVAGNLTKDALEWANKKVKELWYKKEYGFTPEPKLAFELQEVSKSDAYNRMRECIGNHGYLAVVKLGLIIEELSEEGKREKIDKIKNEVYSSYEVKGIRILTMGSTGVLGGIIQYLSDVKLKNNYNQDIMLDHFEKIIELWTKITIFHKSELGQKELEKRVIDYMNAHNELFFVFSIGQASEQAKKAIAVLSNTDLIHKKGYTFNLYSRKEDRVGREWYCWVFRNMFNFEIIPL